MKLIRLISKKWVAQQLFITISSMFIISCSDGTKKFIGRHTISLPLYTTNYDATKTIRELGMVLHPEMHYYDLYNSTIDIYETEDNKLTGQLKYVYPDAGKLFDEKLSIKEQTFGIKNLHILNDTLKFLLEVNPMQGEVFEGCIYENGVDLVVGLPKKLFTWVHKRHCTEALLQENAEYLFFIADQPGNKKELYRCQADSLKTFIISNPKYLERYKPTIDYLTEMVK